MALKILQPLKIFSFNFRFTFSFVIDLASMNFLSLFFLTLPVLALDTVNSGNKDEKNPKALYIEALTHEKGRGVLKDLPLAIELYQESADKGFVKAQYKLGLMLYEGVEVERDLELAFKYLTPAAKEGHIGAKGILGLIYLEGGKGIKSDIPLGEKLVSEAISKKDPPYSFSFRA